MWLTSVTENKDIDTPPDLKCATKHFNTFFPHISLGINVAERNDFVHKQPLLRALMRLPSPGCLALDPGQNLTN